MEIRELEWNKLRHWEQMRGEYRKAVSTTLESWNQGCSSGKLNVGRYDSTINSGVASK
jgi:hypothetical protein